MKFIMFSIVNLINSNSHESLMRIRQLTIFAILLIIFAASVFALDGYIESADKSAAPEISVITAITSPQKSQQASSNSQSQCESEGGRCGCSCSDYEYGGYGRLGCPLFSCGT